MKHRKLTKQEEEQAIIRMVDVLLDPKLQYSGKHRAEEWNKGWGENLKSGDLTPKYFGKYPTTRLNGKLVKGVTEQRALYTIVDALASKYLSKVDIIVEYGCGTGHNLLRMKRANPKARLIGKDWADSAVKLVKSKGIEAFKFDFFNPDTLDTRYIEDTGVYTVAALEQTGTKYKKFVKYLLKNKPSVVVHIEPIPELLDPTKLLDYLSIKYMEKRKYLSGYLDYLRTLEKAGKVKIIEARRSGIGSMFIDGYSIIVWKPL